MKRNSVFAATAATALTIAFSAPASAAPLSAAEVLSLFNGVTAGDMSSSQEVEGRLYVGGNLTGNTLQVGFKDVTPSDLDELIVVGDSTIGTINAQNGSDVTIGGNASGTVELNGGSQGTRTARIGGSFTGNANQGTVLDGQQANDPNFAARFPEIDFAALEADSAFFATLTGTVFDTSDFNNKKIVGAPDADGLSVHNATLADLAGGGYSIDLNGATTVLINVAGTVGSFGMNALGGTGAVAENVIWNFFEATSINVGTAIIGSVLAPLADMTGFGGSTEGSVIARSITLSNGELHSRTFEGTVPTRSAPPPPPSTIPLPAGLPLLLAGLGGLAILRRRAA
ncbi:hypothetical protein DKT77_13175 [Meridianimarinicoccus roseus]|uniref:Choice-of-anchor A domain-containing protein n=1 Tax=Meridianimarinicoccus roseus TaxID=2072018 RepID=A0A2V2LK91_9RHOB|nr:choice-of-anchor A family protein [Meridianimarinicoccus roseus]PWR02233.1 hypothetical protein DKT77_13175 [Meridianimarinicoccus roseus]